MVRKQLAQNVWPQGVRTSSLMEIESKQMGHWGAGEVGEHNTSKLARTCMRGRLATGLLVVELLEVLTLTSVQQSSSLSWSRVSIVLLFAESSDAAQHELLLYPWNR